MKLKLLLLGIAAVIGVFMIHSCSDDYYLEEGFESLAERRITRSVAEPGDDSNTGEVENGPIFPTRSQIENNAYIASKMEEAWSKTKEYCTPSGRREIAFYIYCNPRTGEIIEDVKFVIGNLIPNNPGVRACVDVGDRDDTSESMACGVFHTHTSLYHFNESYSRGVGPSIQDRNTFNAQIMPCFVYDYKYGIDNTTPIDAPAMVHYYGKRRRKVN